MPQTDPHGGTASMKKAFLALSIALNLAVLATAIWLWLGEPFRRLVHPMMTTAAVSFFDAYPVEPGDIVLLGDSITFGGHWNEILPGHPVRNRGIGGDRTDDLLARLDPILAGHPRKLFLLIGTNDLGTEVPQETILANYETLLDRLARETPSTRVYVQSVLPRAVEYRERVERLNEALRAIASARGLTYVDLYASFLAEDGSLRDELTFDEIHLTGAGYREWARLLEPHLEPRRPKP